MKKIIHILTGSALYLLTGCVGYQLGSMLPYDIKSVYIPTFVNETTEPLLEVDTTQAVIEEFQRDGSLYVTDKSNADTILYGSLTKYDLSPLAFDEERNTLANEYRIRLSASIKLVRRGSQEVVAQSPNVEGEFTFLFSGDLTSAKRQALPEAAEDLAHDIVEQLVEYWP